MRRYEVTDEQWEKIKATENVNDCDVACELLNGFNLQGKTIIADRGYSTFVIKNFIETCGANGCIPPKFNFKNSWDYDRENATRFDELASRFLSFVYLASIFSWL